ncbi:MAG TPA: hypothetical protein VH475_04060 [Tepidisphaeraceae bacterium]|jgi:hypothetical protein
MARAGFNVSLGVSLICAFTVALVLGGCKKSGSGGSAGEATVVAIPGIDMKPDGTILDSGLQKIPAQSSAPNVNVIFYRSQLSDAGLAQLGKFPNVHRVEAIGSRITEKGIEKLKQSLPGVEVAR